MNEDRCPLCWKKVKARYRQAHVDKKHNSNKKINIFWHRDGTMNGVLIK